MSRKNIILTLYLASPIVVVIGLVALIFVTLDKEKLMADSPAIGAGAGDTGDANALGQWIAGRDPDAVSLATKAKREGLFIDPRDWPGGIILQFPTPIFNDQVLPEIELRRENELETVSFADGVDMMGVIWLSLSHEQVNGATIWLVHPDKDDRRIFAELQIPSTDLQTSDPMFVSAM